MAHANAAPRYNPMSSVGLAVNVNATVTHAMMQSRFTFQGCAAKLLKSGFAIGVGPRRGRTPQPTSAPNTALGRYSKRAAASNDEENETHSRDEVREAGLGASGDAEG